MMRRYLLLSLLALFGIESTVQAQKYKNFDFDESPNFELTDEMKEEEELLLKNTYSSQYIVSNSQELQYIFTHSVKWINSDDAIQRNNKVYLAASQNAEFLYQKARVIKPNGEIKELQDSDIKEGIYEENKQKYYYFALEGLEKGSIVETINYRKTSPNYYGSLIYFQGRVERHNQLFELICPTHLVFAFKMLNKAPEIMYDSSSMEEYNRWTVTIDSAGPVKQQPTMYTDVVKQGVIFKIDRNNAKNRSDITSYGLASRSIYKSINPEWTKQEKKKLNKIYKELGLAGMKDAKEQIATIENYVKSNFQVVEAYVEELSNLDFILENKTTNSRGMAMLHTALLNLCELKNELVITSDRSSIRFEPDFQAYLFLDKYLIYFPDSKSYLAPSEQFLRSPIVPSEWTHNYGLFIKEVGVGEMKVPIGRVKFIEALPHTATEDLMKINVDFEEDLMHPMVAIEKKSTGYSAQFLQPYFHLMDEEEIGNMKEAVVEMVNEEMKAEEVDFQNIEQNDFGAKPFIYSFKTKEHSFVEKAGGDYLFKLGLLIGPQMEMYQEEERQYDVEAANTRYYGREINFNIPEGYTIKNLDDLNIDYKFGEEGEEDLYFKSDYELNDNAVTVKCVEYYRTIMYPADKFDEYKKVINAAADFNKIVLVLQKDK